MISGVQCALRFGLAGWLFLESWINDSISFKSWDEYIEEPKEDKAARGNSFHCVFLRVMRECGSQVSKAPLFFQVRINLESRINDFVRLQGGDEHIEYPEEYKAGRRYGLDCVWNDGYEQLVSGYLESRINNSISLQGCDEHIENPEEHEYSRRQSLDDV